jgi:hypothetical protein
VPHDDASGLARYVQEPADQFLGCHGP